MNRFEFVVVLSANTVEHVRTIVVLQYTAHTLASGIIIEITV